MPDRIVKVSRKAHFNAAHRLFHQEWTDEKNNDFFGKCANPYYHGHNYELIVTLEGKVDPETGYVINLDVLKKHIKTEVEDYLDHKNLNIQVPEFKNLNPSAENIAIVIWERLRKKLDKDLKLSVTLFETPRNFVEYSGH